jgi:hypothetical protein
MTLLSIYTGCRPAELADASKRAGGKTTSRKRPHTEVWDAVNDLDEDECVDEEEGSDEPNYQQQEPWDNKNDTEYDDDYIDLDAIEREYKTLCYEDIRLWIVRNPTQGERDLLGMEITFAHHKGADRKPKPYVRPQSLCPVPTNFTTLARLSSFMKKPFPYFALSAMSWLSQ